MHRLALFVFVLLNSPFLFPFDSLEMGYLMRSYRELQTTHVYLLSYPRSGNTYMRFCLEYLTKRPTLAFKESLDSIKLFSMPLGLTFPDLDIDLTKECIWKVHSRERIEKITSVRSNRDQLILLVRNYRESLLRELSDPERVFQEIRNPKSSYFDNLLLFDEWDADHRLLVYYEDLILEPKETLERVLRFLNEPTDLLIDFPQKSLIELSLKFYREYLGPTKSRGKDLQHHSRLVGLRLQNSIDQEVIFSHPYLWQKYLKRYQ